LTWAQAELRNGKAMADGDCDVLLIEDDPHDVFCFQRGLRDLGFRGALLNAEDSEQARRLLDERAAQNPPVLIVCDSHLRTDHLHDFLQWIIAHPVYKTVPVVIYSIAGDTRTYIQYDTMQIVAAVKKPQDMVEGTAAARLLLLKLPLRCHPWLE
jgi:response regulator RpfG family c-di-GMP phosphodiesterase